MKVVIFGIQDFAELADYYFTHDSPYEVAAFTVHEAYMNGQKSFRGRPLVPFEQVARLFPPGEYHFFAPLSPKSMNRLRREVYDQAKAMGYTLANYISSKASFFDNEIGDNCFIMEDNTVQPFTKLGSNIIMWSGNHIGHHSIIRDHVMFSSHVVMSGHCDIGEYSYFGVNATLRDGLTIAEGTFVGMAAAVTKNTEPWSAYIGVPAKKIEGKKSYDLI